MEKEAIDAAPFAMRVPVPIGVRSSRKVTVSPMTELALLTTVAVKVMGAPKVGA